MSREPTRPDGKPPHEVMDALSALFDTLPPDERLEAEDELHDAGLDPEMIGQRFKATAEAALARSARERAAPARDAGIRRGQGGAGAVQHTVPPRRPRTAIGAIAAMLIMFGLGYVVGRDHLPGAPAPYRVPMVPPPGQLAKRGTGEGAPSVGHDRVASTPASSAMPPAPLAPQAASGRGTGGGEHLVHLSDDDAPAASAPAAPTAAAAPTMVPTEEPLSESDKRSLARLVTVRPPAAALPKGIAAGEVITAERATEVSALISPGVQWCLQHGLMMTIAPYRKIMWNEAYREATMNYAARVKLTQEGALARYVAGMPFPDLDPNDPQIALKIMWNYEYKPYVTDDEGGSNLHVESGALSDAGPLALDRGITLERAARVLYTGRLYVDPKPVLPNPDQLRSKLSFRPFRGRGGEEIDGIGLMSSRYLDTNRPDDTWLYLPSVRRVRRYSSAQRADALFGQDIDLDSVGGFAGNPAFFDWKYLGSREILASFHAAAAPSKYCEGRGDFIFCDTWELRRAYVVEGTPKVPPYAYAKRLLFIDQETFLIAYSDISDHKQQLWKVWVNEWSFRKHSPFADGTDYPDEMPFNPSFTMVDTLEGHATRTAPPPPNAPESRWTFNQGAANMPPESLVGILTDQDAH
jgi:uncharacterized protein DUF1329